jgi:hypothetical protein
MPTEKSIGSDPPSPAALMQTDQNVGVRWVELPKCSDADDQVPLEQDLSNAAQATCQMGALPGQP